MTAPALIAGVFLVGYLLRRINRKVNRAACNNCIFHKLTVHEEQGMMISIMNNHFAAFDFSDGFNLKGAEDYFVRIRYFLKIHCLKERNLPLFPNTG